MRSPGYVFKRLKQKLRYGLLTKLFLGQLSRLGIVVAPQYLVEESLSPELESAFESGFEEFEFRELGPDDVAVLARIPGRSEGERELLDRLERGNRGFGLWHDATLAAFTWADLSECNDRWNRFALKDDQAYLFDAHTVESFRGRRLAPYMRYRCYQALRGLGRHTYFSVSEAFNTPSIRFKTRLNAKLLSLWLGLRVGGGRRRVWKIKDLR